MNSDVQKRIDRFASDAAALIDLPSNMPDEIRERVRGQRARHHHRSARRLGKDLLSAGYKPDVCKQLLSYGHSDDVRCPPDLVADLQVCSAAHPVAEHSAECAEKPQRVKRQPVFCPTCHEPMRNNGKNKAKTLIYYKCRDEKCGHAIRVDA